MRLEAFIINEGRGKRLEMDEAKALLKRFCKQALYGYTKGNMLYRGVMGNTDNYMLYKSAGMRRSKNTSNYYTLFISNAGTWKGYPRRDKSFICSSSFSYATSFGTVYAVFPYDGAKIGVAPARDFWGSFKKSMNTSKDMDDWNDSFERIISLGGWKMSDSSLSVVLSFMKKFDTKYRAGDINLESLEMALDSRGYHSMDVDWFFSKYKGDFLDVVAKTLDPKKNGFQLMKVGDNYPDGVECWTDSPCIFVRKELVPSRPNPLGNILTDIGYNV